MSAGKDIDLSKLTEREREVYGSHDKKHNLPWIVALWCAAVGVFGLIVIYHETGGIAIHVAIKIVGFIALGLWARTWSRIAIILLLGWHIWMNFQYASGERLNFKIFFWVPSILFVLSHLLATGRAGLIAKAQQGVAAKPDQRQVAE